MRRWIDLALYAIIFVLVIGCRPQPTAPKLIFNTPGPNTPLSNPEWELYEYSFPTALSPREAAVRLEKLGYRFLTPDEESLANTFIYQECRISSLTFGLVYLDHPVIVLIRPKNTGITYVLGFDEGLMPRPLRGFYEHAKLGENYGWLVMRDKNARTLKL